MQVLGNKVPPVSTYRPASVIGEVGATPNQENVFLRIGRVTGFRSPGAWEQTEYVVLTKKEAGDLVVTLLEQVLGSEAVANLRETI